MSNMQTANQPALSRRAIRTRLFLTLIYAALVPYLIYRVGTECYHLSAVNALLLVALSPALRHRSSDPWFVFPTFDAATPDVERFTQACSSGAHSSPY